VAEVEDTDLQFAMTKIEGSDIKYKIGVRKEDKELLMALNSAIRKAMADDSYPEMLKSYFMSKNVVAARRASASEMSYVVARGDTLSTIAQGVYGDMKKYTIIQERNNLANPNFISVGQKLIIPTK
jgi:nucleoid-associated protein YgaU